MPEEFLARKRSSAVRQPTEPRCDAFTAWALATDFKDSIAPGSSSSTPFALWLMLKLHALGKGESPIEQLYQMASQLPSGWLMLPGQYRTALAGLAVARYCTALASPDFIRFLADSSRLARVAKPVLRDRLEAIRARIEAFEIGLQAADWGQCIEHESLIPAAKSPPRSVVGIIDDGLPFAHHRFCWIDHGQRRTRFLALWDQSHPVTGGAARPAGRRWCLGRSLDAADMDRALRAGSDQGRVDDDAVYHHAGMARLLRHRVTHGAHVMDLACGSEPPVSPYELPAIIGVQLRPMESTLCLSSGAHLFDAIRYVVAQADAACGVEAGGSAKPCCITLNASVGNIAGPHDGHSLFEEAVDELLRLRRAAFKDSPINLVLPAGNSNLSRCHAWAQMDPGTEVQLDWHLSPDDGTSSYLEIWLRPVGAESAQPSPALEVALTLTPPVSGKVLSVSATQTAGSTAGAEECALLDAAAGHPLAMLGLYPQPANGRWWMGLVTVAPTAPNGPWTYAPPAGAWKLSITLGASSVPVYCNVYSQRDEKSFGHKGLGRQAVIVDNIDHDFDAEGFRALTDNGGAFRRRQGTDNGLATGRNVRVMGGVVAQPGRPEPARYSSAPLPTRRTPNRKLAVTEDSPVLHGLHAAGSRSGTVVTLSGTSMAVPQLARVLALRASEKSVGKATDFDGVDRDVLAPAADLKRRSRLRRGG